MSSHTRRDFLKTSGVIIGGSALGIRTLSAIEVGNHPAESFLDDPNQGEYLRILATHALNAAEGAGASYADIRLSHSHELGVSLTPTGSPGAQLGTNITYGIRAIVDGALAFNYGNVPTTDAVALVAKNAVTQARGFSQLGIEKVELAPAPVITGEWATSYEIDPFKVPILEQGDLIWSLVRAGARIEGGGSNTGLIWQRETRVCATTEGSLTTQTFQRFGSYPYASADRLSRIALFIPEVGAQYAGYEIVANPVLPERLKEVAEEAKIYAMLPPKRMDVGRYPMVMDGRSVAMMLSKTIAPALEMDRVLGMEAGASGTSFLSPYNDVLDTQLFSPHLSVTLGRDTMYLSGVKWDDECIAPQNVPVIVNGKLMDYATDRTTSSALGDYYKSRGKEIQSNGYASTIDSNRPVVVASGHLTMSPEHSNAQSIDSMIKDMKHGLLMRQMASISTDQQGASGLIHSNNGMLLEIRNGKPVSCIVDAGLQFKTSTLWKRLSAVGDNGTVESLSNVVTKGLPWHGVYVSATAPAASFSAIDLILLSRG